MPVPSLHTSGMTILPVSSYFPSLQNPGEEPRAGNTVNILLHNLEEGVSESVLWPAQPPGNKERFGSGSAKARSGEQKAGKHA